MLFRESPALLLIPLSGLFLACGSTEPTPSADDSTEQVPTAGGHAGGDSMQANGGRGGAIDESPPTQEIPDAAVPEPQSMPAMRFDASIDVGRAVVPDCNGKPLCETFETLELGKPPTARWRTNPGSAIVRVDGKHAASGKQSLFIGTTNGGPSANITPNVFTRWSSDELHGRMMLYFEDIPGKEINVPAHAPIAWGEGAGVTLNVGASNQPGGAATFYNLFFGGGCDQAHNQPRRIPKNQWICVEWSWNHKTNGWQTFVNGSALTALNFTKTPISATGRCWEVPLIEKIFFGWRQNHATQDRLSMWMDDLELSTTRIGCNAGFGF